MSYTAKGLSRYEVEIKHAGLSKYGSIRSDNEKDVVQKAEAQMEQWDKMWAQRQDAENKRLERQQQIRNVEEKNLAIL